MMFVLLAAFCCCSSMLRYMSCLLRCPCCILVGVFCFFWLCFGLHYILHDASFLPAAFFCMLPVSCVLPVATLFSDLWSLPLALCSLLYVFALCSLCLFVLLSVTEWSQSWKNVAIACTVEAFADSAHGSDGHVKVWTRTIQCTPSCFGYLDQSRRLHRKRLQAFLRPSVQPALAQQESSFLATLQDLEAEIQQILCGFGSPSAA